MQQWRADPLTECLTEYRMRITSLEGRMTEVERNTEATGSKHEPPKSIGSLAKEWAPVLLSLVALVGVLMGKITVEQAVGLLKGGP